MEYKRKSGGLHPLYNSPKEIVPDLDTVMVNIVTDERATLGKIWARFEHRDVEYSHEVALEEKPERERQWEARKQKEAADNVAAEGIAYREYAKREGHPHPLFAGSTATAAVVERPPEPEPLVVREPALVR